MLRCLTLLCFLMSWELLAGDLSKALASPEVKRTVLYNKFGRKKFYETHYCTKDECFSKIQISLSNGNSPKQTRYERHQAFEGRPVRVFGFESISEVGSKQEFDRAQAKFILQNFDSDI